MEEKNVERERLRLLEEEGKKWMEKVKSENGFKGSWSSFAKGGDIKEEKETDRNNSLFSEKTCAGEEACTVRMGMGKKKLGAVVNGKDEKKKKSGETKINAGNEGSAQPKPMKKKNEENKKLDEQEKEAEIYFTCNRNAPYAQQLHRYFRWFYGYTDEEGAPTQDGNTEDEEREKMERRNGTGNSDTQRNARMISPKIMRILELVLDRQFRF
ncbi:hypothetical protein FACS189472_13610 [Alphaproteobacteria bacterium]|nr:hypothetical protein FACS189472_13610 [Alphaproteobacteria bacterium]